ncbi:methylglutaconyl-CoA hydratase [Reichenbachiella agariperforans]|uniref:Methylglutaconyl-CoA hydratase n=1 Tax=Reichenbachiella agariperforans TaxID=156994 RepID=A0A1M6LB37_REIAG|nr:enoyl-CoA hydratase/isomerase family protein [Reichenbachiella agariperforans]SHJ68398.1 methylglutaconyl-CoA hydratase [Reichenbachiella agariperforans]
MNGSLKHTINDKVATITFHHPKANALPGTLLAKLAIVIQAIDDNKDVSVIVIRSEGGGTFCAGASFDELLSLTNETEGKVFFQGFAQVINAMRKSPKIILARIQGKTIGGGVGLVSSADYAFATEAAAIKLSELAIGIGPFVIEPAVTRKIGISSFSALALNPTIWKDAQWAMNAGLYHDLSTSIDEMDQKIDAFATNLSNYNPEALLAIKQTLWKNTENWDELLSSRAEISGRLALSPQTQRALKKFKST